MTDSTMTGPRTEGCELTILMPCLNEAETLPGCVRLARDFLARHGIAGEILVADNGSTDGSQALAEEAGARVVAVGAKGYGAALSGGIDAARGRSIIMADSDGSYDFSNLMPFLDALRGGSQLVMGNRFKGGIKPGAMPPLHRYLGNPVLSFIGRLFFRSPIGDFHCGLRGFDRDAIRKLDLRTTGMEFASEMIVKATLAKLRISEVPTVLFPDGRSRAPHLRSWRDGWRHLRFLLMFSPNWLFLYPGLGLAGAGFLAMVALTLGPVRIFGTTFDVNSQLLSGTAIILGVQSGIFSILARQFSIASGLLPPSRRLAALLRPLTLERLLILAGLLFLAGLTGIAAGISIWKEAHFGDLEVRQMMRLLVPSATALSVGTQLGFAAFFKSILALPHR
ncbi:MAG TPA: glycosyltransferase family 2 protein [Dongiaceae bacterium]